MRDVQTDTGAARTRGQVHYGSWAAHNWRWVLGLGVAALVISVALIASAFTSLSVLVWLAGLFLVFVGLAGLVAPLRPGRRGSRLAGAAITIVGGLILLAWPGETLTVLAFVVGTAFTIWGLASIVTALWNGRESRRWDIVVGAGSATLGILMMLWPARSVAVVGVLVGIVAAVWGVVTVLRALELQRAGSRWAETRRLERERIESVWEEFERSEEAREASSVATPVGEAGAEEGSRDGGPHSATHGGRACSHATDTSPSTVFASTCGNAETQGRRRC